MLEYSIGDERILDDGTINPWDTVFDWTRDFKDQYGLSSERIAYLWEKYDIPRFMMKFEDMYQSGDADASDIKVLLENKGVVLDD